MQVKQKMNSYHYQHERITTIRDKKEERKVEAAQLLTPYQTFVQPFLRAQQIYSFSNWIWGQILKST